MERFSGLKPAYTAGAISRIKAYEGYLYEFDLLFCFNLRPQIFRRSRINPIGVHPTIFKECFGEANPLF